MKLFSSIPAIVMTGVMLMASPLANSAEHEHREHGAHEHGAAIMNVAIDNNHLLIELESPAMNIVGFEHAPRNNQQQQAVQHAVTALKKADKLYVLPAEASCQLAEAHVETPLLETATHEHAARTGKDDESHSEFQASYVFQCTNIKALHGIDVQLFKQFKGMQEIRVQLISPAGQTVRELSGQQHKLAF